MWTLAIGINRIDLLDEDGEVIGMFAPEFLSVAQRMCDVQNGIREAA